jgi:hypothetical protein
VRVGVPSPTTRAHTHSQRAQACRRRKRVHTRMQSDTNRRSGGVLHIVQASGTYETKRQLGEVGAERRWVSINV